MNYSYLFENEFLSEGQFSQVVKITKKTNLRNELKKISDELVMWSRKADDYGHKAYNARKNKSHNTYQEYMNLMNHATKKSDELNREAWALKNKINSIK